MKSYNDKGELLFSSPPPKFLKPKFSLIGALSLIIGGITFYGTIFLSSGIHLVNIILILIGGIASTIMGVICILALKFVKELEAYENGISWHTPRLIDIINKEDLFIRYSGIEKIYTNPDSKYIIFQGPGFPGNKGYRKLAKKDIRDIDKLISALEGNVKIVKDKFSAKSLEERRK